MTEKQALILENEAGFKAVIQFATTGILVVGEDGRIKMANPNAEKLFGCTKAELTGQEVEVLIHKDLREKHVAHREGYFEQPKSRTMGQGMELYAL